MLPSGQRGIDAVERHMAERFPRFEPDLQYAIMLVDDTAWILREQVRTVPVIPVSPRPSWLTIAAWLIVAVAAFVSGLLLVL